MTEEINVSINGNEFVIVADSNKNSLSVKKKGYSDEFDLLAFVNWSKVNSKFTTKFPLKEVFEFLIDHNIKFDYISEHNELVIEFKNCDFWRINTRDYQNDVEFTSGSSRFFTSDILYSLKEHVS